MSPEQFTYWLQGFIELNSGKMPTEAQWKSIVEHLTTVFVKVTPPVGDRTYCLNKFGFSSPIEKKCDQESFSSYGGYVIPKIDLSSITHSC